MGHADIQTTMKYLHYAPRAEDARLVAEAFSASGLGTPRDEWDNLGQLRTSRRLEPDHAPPPASSTESSSACTGPTTRRRTSTYGEHWTQVAIDGSSIIEGQLPARAFRLVQEWARLHQAELAADWELAQRLEPLVPIDPLS
jgi:hypothetical protein